MKDGEYQVYDVRKEQIIGIIYMKPGYKQNTYNIVKKFKVQECMHYITNVLVDENMLGSPYMVNDTQIEKYESIKIG